MGKKAVKEKTLEFLNKYPQSNFPVDIIKIANQMGLIVMEQEFDDNNIYGALITKNNCKFILINPKISPEKKLFTIAHEIGHSYLHGKEKDLFYKDNTLRNTPLEEEADDFAADILMPEELVKNLYNFMDSYKDIPDYTKKDFILSNLMKYFGVTKKVAEYRLKKLELI